MSGGPAPFGTRWCEGRLVQDPGEAAVVRELVEIFINTGGRAKATSAGLNANGYRTRRGAEWSDTAVSRVLRNRSLVDLVPLDLWCRCEPLLSQRGEGSAQPRRRSVHPLGGVVHCRCGGRMYARGSTAAGKYVCRNCRAKIAQETLEKLFRSGLASVEFEATELVDALPDSPRAAELTRRLGGSSVPAAEIWPLLDRTRQCQFVDLLVDRIVVGRDQVSVVFAESGENESKSAPAEGETSISSHGPVSETNDATNGRRSKKDDRDDVSPISTASPRGILQPRAYRIQHVADLLNLPKSTVYDLVRTGALASIRTGTNSGVVLVPATAVAELLEKKKRRR